LTAQRREAAIWFTATAIAVLLIALDRTHMFAVLYVAIMLMALALRLFFLLCVRVVKEYERAVVLRLGRYQGTRGPGPIIVVPGLDNLQTIDMRLQFQEVPHESCITKDNARIDVDFLFYWRIKDPEMAALRIKGLDESLRGLATGLLRAVIGDISLDNALAEREHINLQLREKIDEVTEQWGIEVSTVEIREILMPADIQEIMSRQMAAERTRRATVLEAEGYKEAQMLRAQGEATALQMLYEAARQVDANTLSLKYMETLQHIGDGQSTKYVLPMEITGFARRVTEMLGTDHASEESNAPRPQGGEARESDASRNLKFLETLRRLSPEQLKWLLSMAGDADNGIGKATQNVPAQTTDGAVSANDSTVAPPADDANEPVVGKASGLADSTSQDQRQTTEALPAEEQEDIPTVS
jgi:regulator of protease activity HflC (stomatin/prohibitin superfamily)